jgi:periplasmic protein TonB
VNRAAWPLTVSRWTTLQVALALSLALHIAVLTLRVAAPERFERMFDNTSLDVILVNTSAKSETPPKKAQALAQTQLAGGGERRTGRAASPLAMSDQTSPGDGVSQVQRQVANLAKEQSLLLAQVKAALSQLPPLQPNASQLERQQLEQKRRQMLKLLAEIEQRIDQENARPTKHYLSPATREVVYALYYDALKRKIEDHGTRYFPERNGQKLYGELTMVITINPQGRVLTTEIVQSSGQTDLDRRAQAIVTSAGPFGEFNDEMRQKIGQLGVISRFVFGKNNTLQTLGEAPLP